MEVYVDPRAEWDQMYRETWRIERDFFYAPNFHGLDLQATAKKYEPYLASLAHRADLNYLFQEMLGELSVGHLYVGGGDTPDPKRVPGGLLGADYKIENGRYRFAHVYNGENWNTNLRAPAPPPATGGPRVPGRLPAGGEGPKPAAQQKHLHLLRAHGQQAGGDKGGPQPGGVGLAGGDGRADPDRDGVAQSRLDGREPPQG